MIKGLTILTGVHGLGLPSATRPVRILDKMFSRFDVNGDGTLSTHELLALYKALDLNNNGKVSPEELFKNTWKMLEILCQTKNFAYEKDGREFGAKKLFEAMGRHTK